MKLAAIDIGSNSVRLMLWADGKTLFKRMCTTRLGEGLAFSPSLKIEAIDRTAEAVAGFVREAQDCGAEKVYAFATAAVRSADNKEAFIRKVKNLCGVEVDVVSGLREAEIGVLGAVGKGDGGIIDVGGASTEVSIKRDGRIVYSHSVNCGTVRIFDAVGRDMRAIKNFIADRLDEYGEHDFSAENIYSVGGTATRLAAVKLGVTEYDADKLDGVYLTRGEIENLAKWLLETDVEEIRRTTICKRSADVVGGGAVLLAAVMERFSIGGVTVSESDNLEGYILTKI